MKSWVLIGFSEHDGDDSSSPIAVFSTEEKACAYLTSLGGRYYSIKEVDLDPSPIDWNEEEMSEDGTKWGVSHDRVRPGVIMAIYNSEAEANEHAMADPDSWRVQEIPKPTPSPEVNMAIVAFLEARIADDEYWATRMEEYCHSEAIEGRMVIRRWLPKGWGQLRDDPPSFPDDPARVLREVAAKRAIIAAFRDWLPDYDESVPAALAPMAAIYREHRDFKMEWLEMKP